MKAVLIINKTVEKAGALVLLRIKSLVVHELMNSEK